MLVLHWQKKNCLLSWQCGTLDVYSSPHVASVHAQSLSLIVPFMPRAWIPFPFASTRLPRSHCFTLVSSLECSSLALLSPLDCSQPGSPPATSFPSPYSASSAYSYPYAYIYTNSAAQFSTRLSAFRNSKARFEACSWWAIGLRASYRVSFPSPCPLSPLARTKKGETYASERFSVSVGVAESRAYVQGVEGTIVIPP